MASPKRQQRIALLRDLVMIVIGVGIASFGVFNIHRQSGVTEGGVIGLVLLLDHWFKIPPSISTPVLDGICYIIGFSLLGKKFLKYSLFASGSIAIFYAVYGYFGPVLPSLAAQPLLAAILGGLFIGVGVGLVVRVGAASGGDDALALSISHKLKWPISRAYLFTDLVVLVLSLSYIPLRRIFFSLITVTVSSLLIGRIECIGRPKVAKAGQRAK